MEHKAVRTYEQASIPAELKSGLDRVMAKAGFIHEEYVKDEITEVTTVHCPVCGEALSVTSLGNSYRIICPVHGVLSSARGI